MKKREQWGSRIGFILAAVGSAIGVGNIWRFPYVIYENGGGAFLIPYLIAMITAGIPLMILEFGLGHKYRASAPKIFSKISRKWEWLGWWQVFVAWIISLYYIAVIAWAVCYIVFSFKLGWGEDTNTFFFKEFLNLSDSPFHLHSIRWAILTAIGFCWFICWLGLMGGIKHGIEIANKLFMPVLFLILLIIVAAAISLPGAKEGMNWMWEPDFSKIFDYKTWTAAYGQMFYSVSVGFAIMVTYASYLPKDSDINNNAFLTVFLDCGFSLLAGILIFSVLGNMSLNQGVPVSNVVNSGVGLAFITIPKAINSLPMPVLFGTLFFIALCIAGLSSEISLNEVVIAAFMDKTNHSRKTIVNFYCGVGFLLSALFATDGGLLILDIVDHFINNFGILFTALVELILITWLCDLESFRQEVNSCSDFSVGKWWNICLKYITPLLLGYMAVSNLIGEISKAYGGYSLNALLVFGWFMVIIIIPLAFFMQIKNKQAYYTD